MAKNSETLLRCSLLGLMLAAFVVYDPSAHPDWRLCAFHWLTGSDCPLCGLTRSLCAAAKGEWRAAIVHHVLGPAVLASLILVFARDLGIGAVIEPMARRLRQCSRVSLH